MLNFDNVEDLVSYMFENLDNEDNTISVISNKDMVVEIMHELLNYENVILNACEIDDECDYDREYYIALYDDVDENNWYVDIGKSYSDIIEKYIPMDGYVLFHEDVNSKSLIDMQNNKCMPLGRHDLFTIGDEDQIEDDADYESEMNADETEKLILDIGKDMRRELFGIFDMLYRPHFYECRPIPIRFFY